MLTGRGQTCRADKGGFCLWPECPASESTDDPCPLPLAALRASLEEATGRSLEQGRCRWHGREGCPLCFARIQFWCCPEHVGAPHRVEWRAEVAHCLTEGCGRTSDDASGLPGGAA